MTIMATQPASERTAGRDKPVGRAGVLLEFSWGRVFI